MATTAGQLFIEIALKGLTAVQTQLAGLRDGLGKVGGRSGEITKAFGELGKSLASPFQTASASVAEFAKGIKDIGQKIAIPFLAAKAGILATVAVADPKGFADLQVAIAGVAIQIGRIFVPLLAELTGWINTLKNYLKGLTDDQREQILHFTKIGLAIGGVAVILPQVISLLSPLGLGLKLVGTALSVLGTGVSPLLILFTAASLLFSHFGDTSGLLADSIAPIVSAFNLLVSSLKPILDIFAAAGNQLAEAFLPVFETILTLIPSLISLFATLVAALQPVVQAIVAIATVVGKVLAGAVQLAASAIKGVVDFLKGILDTVIDVINDVLEWYNRQKYLPGTFTLIKKPTVGEKTVKDDKEKKPDSDKFRGQVIREAPQLFGIADYFAKLQTAQGETVQERIAREQLQEAKKTNQKLDAINSNVQGTEDDDGGDFI